MWLLAQMGELEDWLSFLGGSISGITVMGVWLRREIQRRDRAESRVEELHAEKYDLLARIKRLNGNGQKTDVS